MISEAIASTCFREQGSFISGLCDSSSRLAKDRTMASRSVLMSAAKRSPAGSSGSSG
jgi:hypothetical protein